MVHFCVNDRPAQHSKWSLVCIAIALHDSMLVFRSFEAIPTKSLFDFSWWHTTPYTRQTQLHTQHVRQRADCPACGHHEISRETGNWRCLISFKIRRLNSDFCRHVHASILFTLSHYNEKSLFICLFVLVLSLQIRSKRFSVFGGFCFSIKCIRTSLCLLPSS